MIIRLSDRQFIIERGHMDGYLFETLNLAAPAPNGGYQSQFKQKYTSGYPDSALASLLLLYSSQQKQFSFF